jgi:phosphoribosylformylglycinamidine synthase PurS subunit
MSVSRGGRSPTGQVNRGREGTTCHHGRVNYSVLVEVRLRPGIADPQGATIERSLPTLGFGGVREVTVGKAIRFTLEAADETSARSKVEDLCQRFLTNPVIEDAVVSLEATG